MDFILPPEWSPCLSWILFSIQNGPLAYDGFYTPFRTIDPGE